MKIEILTFEFLTHFSHQRKQRLFDVIMDSLLMFFLQLAVLIAYQFYCLIVSQTNFEKFQKFKQFSKKKNVTKSKLVRSYVHIKQVGLQTYKSLEMFQTYTKKVFASYRATVRKCIYVTSSKC